MGNYLIKDIENLTGIKAHTIRIWEQRYRLVLPKRTESNIRYYEDDDVKLLLNIALLNRKGHKISKIAELSKTDIRMSALKYCKKNTEYDDSINSLILSTYNLNEYTFNKIFSDFVQTEGFEKTIQRLIFPFLQRLGDLWVTNSLHPALEHFASNIIVKKLHIAIDGATKKKNKFKKFLLFLPPGEMHEIGLLYTNYLIRARGHEAIYLGQNTPFSNLIELIKANNPDYILTVYTNCQSEIDPFKLVENLQELTENTKIILSGCSVLNKLSKFKSLSSYNKKLFVIDQPNEMHKFL